MKKYWQKLVHCYPLLRLAVWKLHRFTLPGFDGVPVYSVYQFFVEEAKRQSISIRARAIAFSFFLALFPALIFIFSVLPYLPLQEVQLKVQELIKSVLPTGMLYNFINETVVDLLQRKKPGLLTGSFLLSLFLTSNGVVALMGSFDKRYDDYQKRNAVRTRLVALGITFILAAMFLLSASLIVAGEDLLNLLLTHLRVTSRIANFLFNFLRYLIIILLFFYSISFIYYFGPARKEKFRLVSTGATVTTILSILTSVGFSYWINHFTDYNTIYGSIGTIMVLMIWFNLNAFILIVGYEINVAIYKQKSLRQMD